MYLGKGKRISMKFVLGDFDVNMFLFIDSIGELEWWVILVLIVFWVMIMVV